MREQLERLLANPSFKNSKRYPALLRYVVERVLEGHTDSLKERTLGIEVFHRDPNYDTNQDPVVRTTAVEVRKRLAQYYQEPGHEHEIRIEFPSGSYMPEFRLPAAVAPAPAPTPVRLRRFASPVTAGAAASAVALAGILVWWSPWKAPSALDRFWTPVWSTSDHVLICVGGLGAGAPSASNADAAKDPPGVPSLDQLLGKDQGVPLPEVDAALKIVGQKVTRGKTFHVRSYADAKFEDLREGPMVLIGGFDNSWTVSLLADPHLRLRFRLERDGPVAWIYDQQNPTQRTWRVDPRAKVAEDYAVISRVWNPATGQVMVSLAGLLPFGTGAAGEFLSDPRFLQAALAKAGKSWQNKNIQFVIATSLTGASSGPPRVLATYFW